MVAAIVTEIPARPRGPLTALDVARRPRTALLALDRQSVRSLLDEPMDLVEQIIQDGPHSRFIG